MAAEASALVELEQPKLPHSPASLEVTVSGSSFAHAMLLAQHVCLAGTANVFGQTAGHPFDVLKVRLQAQNRAAPQAATTPHPIHLRPYEGVVDGLRTMYRLEGGVARGLFPAWRISCVREWWYSGLRMGLYEPVKTNIFGEVDKRATPLCVKIGSGLITGVVAASLSNPFDLLKVRYQVARGPQFDALPPIHRAFLDLCRTGGLSGMFRGYTANMGRACGITATQLASYDHIKQTVIEHQWMSEGRPLHFVASACASLIAIATTNPVDVVKTQMMNFTTDRSASACVKRVFREEGFRGFYKGSTMAWLRLGPHTVVTFVSFETLRGLAGIEPL
jgi:hypothetical protein